MPNFVLVDWNDDAIDRLVNDEYGPVGQMLAELSEKMTVVAKGAVPVQSPRTFSWGKKHSTSYLPWSGGYTKMTTHSAMGYDKSGQLFGGTNAPYGPTIFLEREGFRANGMPRALHPFLTTALESVAL